MIRTAHEFAEKVTRIAIGRERANMGAAVARTHMHMRMREQRTDALCSIVTHVLRQERHFQIVLQ